MQKIISIIDFFSNNSIQMRMDDIEIMLERIFPLLMRTWN